MAIGFFPQLVEIGSGTGRYVFAGGITAAGTGYTVTDNLTAVGGTFIQTLISEVSAVNGSGGVTAVSAVQTGAYSTPYPSTLTYTGGSGSGYQTNASALVVGAQFMAERGTGGDLGASISEMTFSAWYCSELSQLSQFYAQNPAHINDQLFEINFERTGGGTTTHFPVEVTVNIPTATGGGPTQPFYFQGAFAGTVPFYVYTAGDGTITRVKYVNVLVSFNAASQSIAVYVNRTLLALSTGGWISSGAISNPTAVVWRVATRTPGTGGVDGFIGAGDVWVDTTYRDLSIAATQDKWINSDLTAVALPSDGQLAGGGPVPIVFLHTTAGGAPNDFIANGGTGSAWSVKNYDANNVENAEVYALSLFTTLSFEDNNCIQTIGPPPVTGISINMDNVIVSSLLTESPCTSVQFDAAFEVVGPALGLRWSDTRGKTFGNAVPQEFSSDPLWQPQWNRTGMARDRVFELFWSAALKTTLNGAFVEVSPLKT